MNRLFIPWRRGMAVAAMLTALLTGELGAAVYEYRGAATGNAAARQNWSSANNWFSGVATSADDTDIIFRTIQQNNASNAQPNNNIADPFTLNSLTLSNSLNKTVAISGGALRFNGASSRLVQQSGFAHSLANPLLFATATEWGGDGAGVLTLSGSLGGAAAVTKTGSSIFLLSGGGANTNSGLLAVSAGEVRLQKTAGTDAIGVGGLTIAGGTVRLLAHNQINDAAVVTVAAGGLLDLNGQNEGLGNLVFQGGAVTTGAGTLTLAGNVTGQASATSATLTGNLNLGGATRVFSIADGAAAIDLSIGAIISNGGLTKSGPGLLSLGGVNSYAGATTISGGALGINAANNLNGTSGITFDSGGDGTLYALADGITLAKAITQTTAGGYRVDLGDTLTLTGAIGGAGAFHKTGAGTVVLTGANNFSGGTVVNAGALRVNNLTGSATGGGSVTVNSGATLGGAGTIGGPVIVNNGGTVAAGNGLGTLTSGGLTLNAGAVLNVEFLASGADHDRLLTTSADGLTINGGGLNLFINNTATPFDTRGLYELIGYNGAIGGSGVSALSVLNPVNNRTYTFAAGGGFVTLSIGGTVGWAPLITSPDSFWMTGDNWAGNASPLEFDELLFDGFARTINTNNFTAHTAFSGIVFTNTAGAFALRGNAVNLTGNIVNRSSNAQTIDLALRLEGGSREFTVLSGAGALTVNGVLSQETAGLGIVKRGGGLLVLNGANSYSGPTEIVGGVVRANHGGGLPAASRLDINGGVLEGNGVASFTRSLGTGAGNVQWLGNGGFSAHGGTLTVNIGNNVTPATLTWGSGGFVPDGNVLIFGSSAATGVTHFQNPLDLNGATRTIQVNDNSATSADYALLSGQLSNGGLIKTGAGTLVLAANNTYTGLTSVEAGTLVINGTSSSAGAWTVVAGATLSGTGTINQHVTGAGTVAPGNSPGVLTVAQVGPAGGLDFTFEFTHIGSPDYGAPAASLNDVLRINDATPLTADLTLANTVNLHVNTALTLGATNVFRGGFYADNGGAFDEAITNAQFYVYLNGHNVGAPVFVRTVNEEGTQFSGIDGFVMEFGVLGAEPLLAIPEPNMVILLGAGALALVAGQRRHRAAQPRAPATATCCAPALVSGPVRRRRRSREPIAFDCP